MALKPITRQEQIIAGKQLEPITRMERFLKEYGGGSGGGAQSDWNQTDSSAADFIKNKPFGDMPTGGDTLYWDGNTEGLVSAVDLLYKLSDVVVTMSDLANGAIICLSDGTYLEFQGEEIWDGSGEGYPVISIGDAVFIALEDNIVDFDFPLPEKGVYFVKEGDTYATSFTIPGYTGFPVTEKMEEKYLPNNHTRFYYVGDDYLYSDLGVSKVTVEELKTAARKGLIIVQIGANSSMTCSPLDINILTNDVIEYCALTIWHDEFITLYTAEYTAS